MELSLEQYAIIKYNRDCKSDVEADIIFMHRNIYERTDVCFTEITIMIVTYLLAYTYNTT